MRLFRRNRRRLRRAAASRLAPIRTVLRVEALEDRRVLTSLNAAIDSILAAQQSFPATFTSHVNFATVGATLNGGVDLSLTDVDLSFSNVSGTPGAWTGNVTVAAKNGDVA